jgi:hypothetical protein
LRYRLRTAAAGAASAPCRLLEVVHALGVVERAPVAPPRVVEILVQGKEQPPPRGRLLLCEQLGEPREQHLVVAHGGQAPRHVAQPHVLAPVRRFVERPQEAQAAPRALEVLARIVHRVVVERRLVQRAAGARNVTDDGALDWLDAHRGNPTASKSHTAVRV